MPRTPVGFVRSNDPEGPAAVGGAHEGGGGGTKMCVNAKDLGCISDGVFDNYDILQAVLDAYDYTIDVLEICFPAQQSTNDNGFNHYLVTQPLYTNAYMLSLRGVPGLSEYDGVAICTDNDEDIFDGVSLVHADGLGFICGMDPDGTSESDGLGSCFNGVESAHFTNCWFETLGVAVKGAGGRHWFDRCQFYGVAAGFEPGAFDLSVTMTACLFGNSFQAITKGSTSRVNFLTVEGCTFFNQVGLLSGGIDGGIERPWIEAKLRAEVGFNSGAQGGVVIANNNFGACCLAIDIDGMNGAGFSSLFGTGLASTALVNISGNLAHAARPRSGQAVIKVDSNYALIANNVIGPFLSSITGDAIMVHGDHNRVTGNVTKGHRYGVNVLAGSTNTAVEGNTLTGATGSLLDSGTGTTNVNNMA